MLIRAVGGRSRILPIESQQGIDTKIPGQEHLSSPGKGGNNQILINSYERVPSPIFSA